MDARLAFEIGSALCIQISLLIATTFALQRWVGDARSQNRLWTTCFVLLIAMVAAGVLLPHRRWMAFPADLSSESVLAIVAWQNRITFFLISIWGLGVAVSLLRRVAMCFNLLAFLRHRCDAVDADELLGRLQVATLGDPQLSILTSAEIHGPFCWQLHRPVIVLPEYLLDDDDLTVRHVLLHELEHLRTSHPMQHFLQGVCSTLFWFHPVVLSAARGAELTREFLCDEVAAKTAGRFGPYVRTLAKIAERCNDATCRGIPSGALAFGNRKSALVRRCDRLLKLAEQQPRLDPIWHGPTRPDRIRSAIAAGCLLLGAILIQQIWLPTNAMASQRSDWSPWPHWTANTLHHFDVQVRDFEVFEDRVHLHEWMTDD